MTTESPIPIPFQQIIMNGVTEASHPPSLTINIGEGCNNLLDDSVFQWMAIELVNNCAEKKTDEGVLITIGLTYNPDNDQFCLSVGDNVRYSSDQMPAILKNLQKKQSGKLGKSQTKISRGGLGKTGVSHILESWGGNLTYSAAKDNSVLAVATWQRALFLNPLDPGK